MAPVASWWCTSCGAPAEPGPDPSREGPTKDITSIERGSYTMIDQRGRYDIGYCPCTPKDCVVLCSDATMVRMIIEAAI